ncbi:Zn-dependent metalloprotease [Psychromicrobium silvestre]|uniref:Neutral metalloproteinase n=1 Tax=Psychromicrobium silvestre TaxID=1645614 RepID=A0A7Y9S677_9MICC|nr:M4 family metallopeptidase [Psychromicrobium silvestre]NYE94865.1 Zn-dependent metalloprotease [Psychromicrobium silvestre]
MKKIYATTGMVLTLGLLCATQFATTAQAANPAADKVHAADVNVHHAKNGSVEQIVLKTPFQQGSLNTRSVPSASLAPGIEEVFASAAGSDFVLDQSSTNYLKRFTQTIAGVPVLGSSVTQVLDGQGAVTSAIGSVTQNTQGTFPADSAAGQNKALKVASKLAFKNSAAASGSVVSQRPVWFDQALTSVPSAASVAVPAYEFVLNAGIGEYRTIVVAADAKGSILQDRSDRKDINRVICDRNSKKASTYADLKCGVNLANTPKRTEGQGAYSVADVNSVYNFLGDTSSFYASNTKAADLTTMIGLNENDGLGQALRATVRVCLTGDTCPYANAFWGAGQMTYGQGVTTDDVTAHELTHGVTEKVNNLAYENESGAINESMSDVFGEFVDLSNNSADDTAGVRWSIGEGSSLGVIRSMKDPGAYGDPAIYKGTNWKPTTTTPSDANDQGGVHSNSGVGNKLAFLITDGQVFNGQTVQGIGIAKASQLYWAAQLQLTSNATYSTLANALTSACSANVANNVAGTTSADCTQVNNALKAVALR